MRYHTDDVLAELQARGDENAYWLAVEKLPGVERRFKRLTTALAKLLEDVQKDFPDAMYYTGSGGLNLLLGDSHAGNTPHQELIAFSAGVKLHIGDGDW